MICVFVCLHVGIAVCVPPACICCRNKCDERRCGLSLDLFHSFFHFVVERAFVAWTHDAQVFLARALEEGINGKCDGH